MSVHRAGAVAAVGRLGSNDGPWFGLVPDGDGYRLAYGETAGDRAGEIRAVTAGERQARRDVLLAVIAFFEPETVPPPPDLEATQLDVAQAVRWLARVSGDEAERHPPRDPDARAELQCALDAIDDGLPADVVVGHLYDALRRPSGGPRPARGVAQRLLLERVRRVNPAVRGAAR